MNIQKGLLAILASGAWIGLSEFTRNELCFKKLWIDKYANMGLGFPSEMVNNALWGVWSLLLAGMIVYLTLKLKFWETVIISWMAAFVMMWVVIGNLNVLPETLLWFAVPWSIAEVLLASVIARAVTGVGKKD